jgi:Aspartyl protease
VKYHANGVFGYQIGKFLKTDAMSKQHAFKRHDADSLIILKGRLAKDDISFALDTGASHTVIDLTQLLIAGFEVKDATGTVQIETAKGVLEAYLFRLPTLTVLGITRKNIEICSYDFFSNHIFTDFDGVLGLDFLEDSKICIDFRESFITVS